MLQHVVNEFAILISKESKFSRGRKISDEKSMQEKEILMKII